MHYNIDSCSHHQCKFFRKRTRVFYCRYCKRPFCRFHLRAKPAGMPRFKGGSVQDRLFMDEWHKPGGHPCIPYVKHWEAENQREKDRYGQALDRFIRHRPIEQKEQEESEPVRYNKPVERKEPHKYWKYIIAVIVLIFVIWLFMHLKGMSIFIEKNCTDGTLYNQCSKDKPSYCFNGTLINNASNCGCLEEYKIDGNDCKKIQRCEDRTIYNECSLQKPHFCWNGILVNKSALCGCPEDEVPYMDDCISKYQINPKNIKLPYIVNGAWGSLDWEVFGGMKDYLSSISRIISYSEGESAPAFKDFVIKNIDNDKQREFLLPLVEKIKGLSANSDNQARIAVSIVQNIPYDYDVSSLDRYAYEVLYDDTGVCGEKSRLLAFLLKELGYGVALIDYGNTEPSMLIAPIGVFAHEAIGIKCPIQYSYKNTGYCFIETTNPSIITDNGGDYPSSIFCIKKIGSTDSTCLQKLPDDYTLTIIADGKSFDSVSGEYNDAQEFDRINALGESSANGYLDAGSYSKWEELINEYGIKINWQK